MMSAFFVRALAFRPSALAIAKSWSLSLASRTDCSSASAATRYLFRGSGRCPGGVAVPRFRSDGAQLRVFAVVWQGWARCRCAPRRHRPT